MSKAQRILTHTGRKRWAVAWLNYQENSQLVRILCAIIFLYSSIVHAQTPTREQLTGTWFGVHTEWDDDNFCTLPIYLRLEADNSYQLGLIDGSANRPRSTWSVQGDSVRLDTIRYAPGLVRLQNDLLHIGILEPMVFRRFQPISLDSAKVFQRLNGRIWQSDSLRISLFDNGRAALENLLTKQRTAHFWRLARFDTSVILVVWGNAHNRESGYKALWQLVNSSANQLQLINWNGREIATESFRLVRALTPNDIYQPTGFQTCANCFGPFWNIVSVNQPDKRYELRQMVEKQYQPVQEVGQSGLLAIKFVVNCAGQVGPMAVKGFGDDYCPKVFTTQLVDQFLKICRDHISKSDFIRPNTENTPPYDITVSLTFRLKDGQLLDILP